MVKNQIPGYCPADQVGGLRGGEENREVQEYDTKGTDLTGQRETLKKGRHALKISRG